MEQPGGLLLRQPLEEAEQNGLPLLLWQAVDGLPQGDALHHAGFRLLRAQQGFQRQAVRRLLLQGLRRYHRQLNVGDFLHGQARLFC